MRVGIIGFGSIARHHVKAFQQFSQVEILVSSRSEENRQGAKDLGIQEIYPEHHTMMKEGNPDALLICVPPLAVVEVMQSCIPYGKPILVEKPVGLHPSETLRLAELADVHNCPVMVGMNRRFYTNVSKAKEMIKKGELLGISVNAPDRMHLIRKANIHPPEVLERWLYANIIHSLDLIRFWGGDALFVNAIKKETNEPFTNSYIANIVMENDIFAQYTAHFSSPGRWCIDIYLRERRISFTGHESAIVTDRSGETYPLDIDGFDLECKPGFYHQASYFLEEAQSNRAEKFKGFDLWDAVKTMELIREIDEAPFV